MSEKYSVRCFFRIIDTRRPKGKYVYEERIILIDAENFTDAFAKAEIESRRYADSSSCGSIKIRFIPRFLDAYLAYDQLPDEPVWEVYSRFRKISSVREL